MEKNEQKRVPNNVLAEGEVTGHFHQAIGRGVAVFGERASADRLTLSAPKGATVKHQEHKPVNLPAGDYDRTIVQEYDHFAEEARRVVD